MSFCRYSIYYPSICRIFWKVWSLWFSSISIAVVLFVAFVVCAAEHLWDCSLFDIFVAFYQIFGLQRGGFQRSGGFSELHIVTFSDSFLIPWLNFYTRYLSSSTIIFIRSVYIETYFTIQLGFRLALLILVLSMLEMVRLGKLAIIVNIIANIWLSVEFWPCRVNLMYDSVGALNLAMYSIIDYNSFAYLILHIFIESDHGCRPVYVRALCDRWYEFFKHGPLVLTVGTRGWFSDTSTNCAASFPSSFNPSSIDLQTTSPTYVTTPLSG